MSSANAAAVAVVLMTIVLLGGRMLVRGSRGNSFSLNEAVTAIGLIAIALTIIALSRSDSLIYLLPVALIALGILMLSAERNRTMGRLAAITAYGAIALGVISVVISVLGVISRA